MIFKVPPLVKEAVAVELGKTLTATDEVAVPVQESVTLGLISKLAPDWAMSLKSPVESANPVPSTTAFAPKATFNAVLAAPKVMVVAALVTLKVAVLADVLLKLTAIPVPVPVGDAALVLMLRVPEPE